MIKAKTKLLTASLSKIAGDNGFIKQIKNFILGRTDRPSYNHRVKLAARHCSHAQ